MSCAICGKSHSLQCPECGRFVCSNCSVRNQNYHSVRYICIQCSQDINKRHAEIATEQEAQKIGDLAKRQAAEKRKADEQKEFEYFRRIREEKERIEHEKRERELDETQKCPHCGGKGTLASDAPGLLSHIIRDTCGMCGGTGRATKRQILRYEESERNRSNQRQHDADSHIADGGGDWY